MQFVLVDFENVQPSGLEGLVRGKHHVRLFVGASQSKIPFETARALQALGSDAEYVQITGSGRNALDFHIAYHLGRLAVENPAAKFLVVSKDTGFDPLVEHMRAAGLDCRRVAAIDAKAEASAKAKPAKPAVAPVPKAAAGKGGTEKGRAEKGKADKTPPADAGVDVEIVKNTVERLNGMRNARPRTLKTLGSSIKAWHKLDDAALSRLLLALTSAGTVKVDGKKKLTYRFD